MNFVFLSPNFPKMYYRFGAALKSLGANVLGVGDEYFENLTDAQKAAMTEYYRVESLENYDQTLRALGYFTQRYGKINQIDSFNEYWLEEEAALRTDFNIDGLKLADMKQLQRKSYMKRVYQKAGIRAPKGIVYEMPEDAREFVAEVGFPIIAKPDKGVGAQKTYKINDANELEEFIANSNENGYFLEEFIKGQLESFDGLTDQDGKVVFYTSHVFSQGIMETVNKNLDLMYYSRRDVPEDLLEAGLMLHNILKLRTRFFHFEFFRTVENSLIALEMNLRPPGGLTTDMFNFANDFDIYYQWANVILFNKFNASDSRPYHVCFAGRKNQKQYSLSHQEVLSLMGKHLVHHEPINPVFRNAIGDYGYILRDPDLGKVTHLANLILQKV
jgi:hypothetical protein